MTLVWHDASVEIDRDRWDERWRAAGPRSPSDVRPLAPDVVASNSWLLDILPTEGRALDVACGVGAQALWLAERGLHVTAIDVSPVAIDCVEQAARHRGCAIEAFVWDSDDRHDETETETEAGVPADLDDLAVIVCQRYRAQHLYSELVDRLRPGGVLILTVLSTVGLDGDAGPFHALPGELHHAFLDADADVLVDVEAEGQASIVLRRRTA